MNIEDRRNKIISPLVANRLPLTVKKDYDSSSTSTTNRSIFSDFVQAYYEFVEREISVTLNYFKNVSINRYKNSSILSLGPQEGGPYNITNRLSALRDFDHTIESLRHYIKFEYLQNIPDTLEGNMNNLMRIIRTINLSKGTEAAYKALFRFLWNKNVELSETANEIFRPSDNHYKTEKVMRIKLIGGSDITDEKDIPQFKDNYAVGVESGAKILVNSVSTVISGSTTFFEMSVDEGTLESTFLTTEEVYAQSQTGNNILISGTNNIVKAKIVPGISDITLTNNGMGYVPGDIIEVKSDTGSGAEIQVKSVTSGPVDLLMKESDGAGYVIGIGSEAELSFSSSYIDVYTGELAGVQDVGGAVNGISVNTVGYTGSKSHSFTNVSTIGAGNDDLVLSFDTDTFGSVGMLGEIKTYTVTPPTSDHWPSMTYVAKTAVKTSGTGNPDPNAIFTVDVVAGAVKDYVNNAPGTGSGEIDWTDNTFNELIPVSTSGNGAGATFKVVISGSSTNFAVTTVKSGSGYANNDTITINEPNNGTGTPLVITLDLLLEKKEKQEWLEVLLKCSRKQWLLDYQIKNYF